MNLIPGIFKKNDKFYFWDETFTEEIGPFLTEKDALYSCTNYHKCLFGVLHQPPPDDPIWKTEYLRYQK